jgi:hypothetical protein
LGKFYEDGISAQKKIWKTMFLKFEHYDLMISEGFHYEFLRGCYSNNKLKDPMIGFKKGNKRNLKKTVI